MIRHLNISLFDADGALHRVSTFTDPVEGDEFEELVDEAVRHINEMWFARSPGHRRQVRVTFYVDRRPVVLRMPRSHDVERDEVRDSVHDALDRSGLLA